MEKLLSLRAPLANPYPAVLFQLIRQIHGQIMERDCLALGADTLARRRPLPRGRSSFHRNCLVSCAEPALQDSGFAQYLRLKRAMARPFGE